MMEEKNRLMMLNENMMTGSGMMSERSRFGDNYDDMRGEFGGNDLRDSRGRMDEDFRQMERFNDRQMDDSSYNTRGRGQGGYEDDERFHSRMMEEDRMSGSGGMGSMMGRGNMGGMNMMGGGMSSGNMMGGGGNMMGRMSMMSGNMGRMSSAGMGMGGGMMRNMSGGSRMMEDGNRRGMVSSFTGDNPFEKEMEEHDAWSSFGNNRMQGQDRDFRDSRQSSFTIGGGQGRQDSFGSSNSSMGNKFGMAANSSFGRGGNASGNNFGGGHKSWSSGGSSNRGQGHKTWSS